MASSKTPLYVRLPHSEAAKLDRAAFALAASKQTLVAGLVARYVDPSSASGLEALRELTGDAGSRRVTVETADDSIAVGRPSFLPAGTAEVLNVDELAALLKVEPAEVEALAEDDGCPAGGSETNGASRARAALEWLAEGDVTSRLAARRAGRSNSVMS